MVLLVNYLTVEMLEQSDRRAGNFIGDEIPHLSPYIRGKCFTVVAVVLYFQSLMSAAALNYYNVNDFPSVSDVLASKA